MADTMNRRALLRRIASSACIVAPAAALAAVAAVPAEPNAELIALGAEIVRRAAEAKAFQETRIAPLTERFEAIVCNRFKPRQARLDEACAYSSESGREAAIGELHAFDAVTDAMLNRLMAIPATTQAGRAAKVRALLVYVMGSEWRGPADELDWEKDMARALLGEFAGMSATELEAI